MYVEDKEHTSLITVVCHALKFTKFKRLLKYGMPWGLMCWCGNRHVCLIDLNGQTSK